ncbi:YhcN/YlaJ family sporulation lipoprotein [Paenibacillus sonchi]|uniref:YhcN/YlaJ family sporulation lipoprotein n=1 Tax=Paenibacillus sonchi TaxID=373687 RepID=UPI001E50B81A|nr:YhcN/YlaJ family sporulation lipoprotein [Paenibacillus sonchi]MCE3202942.1 YhcN/YlaJ family sporulation lipoprotein [Paenibacillus sonchi]
MLRSKISMSVSAALLLGVVSITGCGTNNTASDNKVHTQNVRGTHDGRLGVNSVQGVRANAFDKMEVSEELADRIAAMPEVRSANVVVAGKSAYVAVVLDEASGGVHAKSNRNTTRINSYNGTAGPSGMVAGSGRILGRTTTGITGNGDTRGSRNGVPGMTGVGGSMTGIPGSLSTGRGTVGGTGLANPGAFTGNGGNGIMSGNNMTDGRVLKRDIDRGMGTAAGTRSITPYSTNGTTGMNGMNGTNGMGTGAVNGTNANGVNTLANDTVTRDMKEKIAAEVKKYDKNIDNVYVSANPDFVDRANFYAQEFRAGHPLRGFAREFGTMVQRIFPTRSGY